MVIADQLSEKKFQNLWRKNNLLSSIFPQIYNGLFSEIWNLPSSSQSDLGSWVDLFTSNRTICYCILNLLTYFSCTTFFDFLRSDLEKVSKERIEFQFQVADFESRMGSTKKLEEKVKKLSVKNQHNEIH